MPCEGLAVGAPTTSALAVPVTLIVQYAVASASAVHAAAASVQMRSFFIIESPTCTSVLQKNVLLIVGYYVKKYGSLSIHNLCPKGT